jgi:hypothetical protein
LGDLVLLGMIILNWNGDCNNSDTSSGDEKYETHKIVVAQPGKRKQLWKSKLLRDYNIKIDFKVYS